MRRRAVVAGIAAACAVFGAAEWQVMQERAAENARLAARRDALRIENARTEQMIVGYDEFARESDRLEREFAAALEAVPTEAELAGAVDDLERVAAASGVNLVRFVPATPRAPGAKSGPAVTVQSRPITIGVRCAFDDYRELLSRLAAYPRLLTVESFSMKSASAGRYSLEATIGLNCYFKQVPAEAGAAPAPK